ncbi:hypothetical protein [Olivibacter sitiensis]|uniref:hypothetical protein n=1 Tax=Olivibacter sitiensis TaxID=376470 RepID=UPI00056161A9|nr:hypothetical protein [Olivibacter sitiensis]
MIEAVRLFTGEDGNSHFEHGHLMLGTHLDAVGIHFKETAAGSSYDWHTAPVAQFVITLSGLLKFEVLGGESFLLKPGMILIAEDLTGTGHKWEIIGSDPWKRGYVPFADGQKLPFVSEVRQQVDVNNSL